MVELRVKTLEVMDERLLNAGVYNNAARFQVTKRTRIYAIILNHIAHSSKASSGYFYGGRILAEVSLIPSFGDEDNTLARSVLIVGSEHYSSAAGEAEHTFGDSKVVTIGDFSRLLQEIDEPAAIYVNLWNAQDFGNTTPTVRHNVQVSIYYTD